MLCSLESSKYILLQESSALYSSWSNAIGTKKGKRLEEYAMKISEQAAVATEEARLQVEKQKSDQHLDEAIR